MSEALASAGWREYVLRNFPPEIAKLARITIAVDPDQLLTEVGVQEGLRQRGFDLIQYDDHVKFRYEYESRYRGTWDRGEWTSLVVVLRTEDDRIERLPFDLLERGRRQERVFRYSIAELFPNLSPNILAALDRADFDEVYEAQHRFRPGNLGENATKDFVLHHVFKIAPETVRTAADLLRLLLEYHYRPRRLPPPLTQFLLHILSQNQTFTHWPLGEIVPDSQAFYSFLQERWPLFLSTRSKPSGDRIADPNLAQTFRYPGVPDLPFDDPDVRVYVDNLFVDGCLVPARDVPIGPFEGTWMAVGIATDQKATDRDRFAKLTERLEHSIPAADAHHSQWVQFALRWAECVAVFHRLSAAPLNEDDRRIQKLRDQIEARFEAWMLANYRLLHNSASASGPVMLHQVPHFLAREGRARVALIVADGLALSQSILVKEELLRNGGALIVHDGGTFAWVPTLTSVSRQAIFAGDLPIRFASSIGTTAKEETHWKNFWEAHGAKNAEVAYVKEKAGEPGDAFRQRVQEAIDHPKCRILGVVVTATDGMLHGLDDEGALHAQTRHWLETQHLRRMVEILLGAGFFVYLTADHGNTQSTAMGRPNVGVLAESKGERAYIFPNDKTRQEVHEAFPETIVWPEEIGLPSGYLALIAKGNAAFGTKGARTVAHGGISLEEVIVPFFRIERKQ